MTDPWAPPDDPRWSPLPPPGYAPPPRRPRAALPLVALGALGALVAVLAVAVAVAPHPGRHRTIPSPRPFATVAPTTATPAPRATARPYVPPPGGLPVSGTVRDAAGRPVTGAHVSLVEHQGFAEAMAHALTAIGSLGFLCAADADVCTAPYGEAVTGPDGRFTVYLQYRSRDYDLAITDRTTSFATKVDVGAQPLRLGDIRLWSPRPRVATSGHTAYVRYDRLPAALGRVEYYYSNVTTGDIDGPRLVELGNAAPGVSFDLRRVEDVAGRLWVTVRAHGPRGTTTYAASTPVAGRVRPVSRGAACGWWDGPRLRPIGRCALTDGDLTTEWRTRPPADLCPSDRNCETTAVGIDLGAVRHLTYVSVHGCDPFFDSLQSSTDGRHWTTLVARHAPSSDHCAAPVSANARWVRVVGPFVFGRAEIAAF